MKQKCVIISSATGKEMTKNTSTALTGTNHNHPTLHKQQQRQLIIERKHLTSDNHKNP